MLELLENRVLLSRVWYVSTGGHNSGPGTFSSPLQTIQQAASLAEPGDTVFIRGGTYHETVTPARSGTSSAPITYAAYGNETVTIDGADPITGWSRSSGSIYSAPQPWDLGVGNNQLLVNGQAMNEAQWPNTAVSAVKPSTATMSSVYVSTIGPGFEFSDTATISVSGLPGGPGAWVGATIHYGAGQDWTVQTGTVVASSGNTLTFAYQHQTNYETPVAGNHFYLTGKYVGLDSAGEWYRDPATGRVYLWTPSGATPANYTVEAKHRQNAIDLSNLSYINVNNIHIIAATIRTNAASHNLEIGGLHASYVSQQMLDPLGWINDASTTGILLLGSHNILQNSTIDRSSGNGVFLGGSYNTVQHTTITNTDYSGADYAAITMVGYYDRILSNTLYNTGRDGILNSDSIGAAIESNTIYNIGLQTTDLGAIYDFGTDSHGAVIAYNTISNIYTGGFGGDGIYLDNGSADYVVHDNVLNNVQIPIKLNAPSFNNSVYNNKVNGKLVKNSSSGGGTPAARSAHYSAAHSSLTLIGTLGGFRSNGGSINSRGQVVGASLNGHSETGFLYSNGSMTAIDPYGTGEERANSINDYGSIAGAGDNALGNLTAFIDSGGRVQTLGALAGDSSSVARDINNAGQVAGVSYGASAIGHAFLYSSGAFHFLPTLGGHVNEAFALNDHGAVVGDSTLAGDRDARAVEWVGSGAINLGTLGGSSSYAMGINNSGLVVGASKAAGNKAFHAFLYSSGKMHDLGTLSGYANSVATGINSSGVIVGYAYNGDTNQSHAWVYRNGVMTDLNKLAPAGVGYTLTLAAGINDSSQIVGSAAAPSLQGRAYVLALLG